MDGISQRIAMGDVEFLEIDIVQEHVDSAQAVSGQVDLLAEAQPWRTLSWPSTLTNLSSSEPEHRRVIHTLLISLLPTTVMRQVTRRLPEVKTHRQICRRWRHTSSSEIIGIAEQVDGVIRKTTAIESASLR